jgi:HEAT repeat protein
MSRKRGLVLFVLLIVTSLFVGWLILRPPPETIYRGSPLSVWLTYSRAGDAYVNGFKDLLEERHAEIVPLLIKELNTKEGPMRRPYLWLRAKCPIAISKRMPEWPDPAPVRQSAAYWLGTLGPEAQPALPALCDAVSHDPVPMNRDVAITVLTHIGIQTTQAIACLVVALATDPDKGVRCRAAGALEIWMPDSPEVIAALERGLSDSNVMVRQICAATLGSYGPRSRLAVGKLEEIAAGDDPAADYAKSALKRISQ